MTEMDIASYEYMKKSRTLSVGYRCPDCLFDIQSFRDSEGEIIYCKCGNVIILNSDHIKICKCGCALSSKNVSFKCQCGTVTNLKRIEKYYTARVKED